MMMFRPKEVDETFTKPPCQHPMATPYHPRERSETQNTQTSYGSTMKTLVTDHQISLH